MTAHHSNKRKKDPYKLFVRITVIIAAVALLSFAVFLACNALVDSEYTRVVEDIHQQNIADEQAFNMELSALRENAAQSDITEDENVEELQTWQATIGETNWRIEDEGAAGLENTYTITISNTALCEGGLMLVNTWHPVPDYFSSANLVSVGATSGWSIP